MHHNRSAASIATAAALAALGISVPAAHADSISYVKDGNVYLTNADGSQTMQVTSTGGYSSASQSDDGRILGLKGGRFHLMNRWGDLLADFSPVGSGTAGSITLSGPFDPAISPDGTKVAYGFYVQYKSGDPNCGKPGGCMQGQLYTGTGYSRSDAGVEWNAPGFQPQYSWTDPSWIDDTQTLVSSPTSAYVKEAALDTAGDGKDATEWFSDPAVQNLSDGEMTRQRTAAAFLGNTQHDHLLVYRTPSAPPATPERCLDAPVQGGAWNSPTWSPDGGRLAWAGPKGIYVAELPGLAGACPDAATIKVSAFAEGATSPDWGPADLPGPRPQGSGGGSSSGNGGGSAGGAGTPAPGGGQQGGTGTPAGSTTMLKARGANRRGAVLRDGIKVSVQCATGRVDVRATLGKSLVARGRTTCSGKTKKVTLRLSKAGRARLRASRKPVLRVSAGGSSIRVSVR